MRILAAPTHLALDPSGPITVDLIVHNDGADDGVAFPTFVSEDAAAEATFEPTIGFLAAGTAQRFRVHLTSNARRRPHTHAQWILFAGGAACEQRHCALVWFDAAAAPSREVETPPPAIDPQRKADILALARTGATSARRAPPCNPWPWLGFALVAIAGMTCGLRFAPQLAAKQVASIAPLRASPPTQVSVHRARPHARPRAVAAPRRTSPPNREPIKPAAAVPRMPRILHGTPLAKATAKPRPIVRAIHAPGGAPVLLAIDVPHEVRAGTDLSVRVLTKRAAVVRVVAKIGPALVFERTLPALSPSTVVIAPQWAGHVQLLTIRVWAKNSAGTAGSYATVAIVQ